MCETVGPSPSTENKNKNDEEAETENQDVSPTKPKVGETLSKELAGHGVSCLYFQLLGRRGKKIGV
jgi:hypothetical protein